VVVHINGTRIAALKIQGLNSPVRYIGNSKTLESPFTYLIDLRVYNRILNDKEIRDISYYENKQCMYYNSIIVSSGMG
jgi:hypothetical protein